MPKLILIEGPSGSGKSSLAKAMQEELLPQVWLHFSLDSIIYTLPQSVLEQCNLDNNWSQVDGKAIYGGVFSCLRSLLDNGNSVIFDLVVNSRACADQLDQHLDGLQHVAIGLTCEWSEIERRTQERGDRTLAEAKASYDKAGMFYNYDVVTDTTHLTPEELAGELKKRLIEAGT